MNTRKNFQIYQKIGEDEYLLIHPETSADNVVVADSEIEGRTVLDVIVSLSGEIDGIKGGDVVTSIRGESEPEGRKGDVVISKGNLGLGNLTNDAQVKRTEMGARGGVATLDGTGKVPVAQLPSYVDDIVDGWYYEGKFYSDETHEDEIPPEKGKIYVDQASGSSYRWSGSVFVLVSNPISIGTEAGDAYDGAAGAKNASDIEAIKNGTEHAGRAKESDVAEKLKSAVSFKMSGDISGEVSFDGSKDVEIQTSLRNSGVEEGSYSAVRVNSKGIVTEGAQVIEVGKEGQEAPSGSLAVGGLFFMVI